MNECTLENIIVGYEYHMPKATLDCKKRIIDEFFEKYKDWNLKRRGSGLISDTLHLVAVKNEGGKQLNRILWIKPEHNRDTDVDRLNEYINNCFDLS